MTAAGRRTLILTAVVAMVVTDPLSAIDARRFRDGKEDLVHYLKDTVELASRVNGETILPLRNRLDNVYSEWLLRFDPLIEKRILGSLERMALEGAVARDRYEAAIALGIMRSPTSLPILERVATDADPDVRKYATRAIEEIGRAATAERSYK